jgi:spermidine synthase
MVGTAGGQSAVDASSRPLDQTATAVTVPSRAMLETSQVRKGRRAPNPEGRNSRRGEARGRIPGFVHLLLFVSGFTGLAYQVLWLKDLALVFGSTTHAAAVGLAAFFVGLGTGAHVLGRRAAGSANGIRAYGWLEVGVAAAALLVLALLDAYRVAYPALRGLAAASVAADLALKALLAIGCLFIPTFLMGGTLPFVAQAVIADPARRLGRAGAALYAANTLGAAAGAAVTGFLLPTAFGYRRSYALVVALNAAVGVAALLLSRSWRGGLDARMAEGANDTPPRRLQDPTSRRRPSPAPTGAAALAAASGLLTLGLEVLWVRMLAQVLDNSVYAFSAILVVVLAALGLGSLLAARLSSIEARPGAVLASLLALSGLAILAQPFAFVWLTNGLEPLGAAGGRAGEIWLAIRLAALTLLPAGVLAGTVFPYLLRLAQPTATSAGLAVGRLTALNTAGAIAGSLATGFLVLPRVGLWPSFAWFAGAYLALAWLASRALAGPAVPGAGRTGRDPSGTVTAASVRRHVLRLGTAGAIALAPVLLVDATALPIAWLDLSRGERLLAAWYGGHGIVTIVDSPRGRVLKLDNAYSLGGTLDGLERERIQARLPLLVHPRPRSAFFLGLGAGITAGEAVRHPLSRIVVCELVPDVVRAARGFFAREANGLFDDPRVEVVVEDGRQVLATRDERFDVIVGDLFVPWHAGTGSLYTREHFEAVRRRLAPGGLFAQWLPLYQLAEREFQVIARTMLAVFPHVTIWRGDFYAARPIVALVGSNEPFALDPDAVVERARALAPGVAADFALAAVLPFYAGNLGAARDLLPEGPLNTDDRPLVEYWAPLAGRAAAGAEPWFTGEPLRRFYERLLEAVPPGRDPTLARVPDGARRYAAAGLDYYAAIIHRLRGEDDQARQALERALSALPEELPVAGPFMSMGLLALPEPEGHAAGGRLEPIVSAAAR